MERFLETRHAVKRFSIEDLGDGSRSCGGAAARKRRFEVLERCARTGAGLSPEQRNDWAWWKEAWDAAMIQEHKERWGSVFASWIQAVLDKLHDGVQNAFSLLVHQETVRLFDRTLALQLP